MKMPRKNMYFMTLNVIFINQVSYETHSMFRYIGNSAGYYVWSALMTRKIIIQ